MLENLIRVLLLSVAILAVVCAGWEEPLRYRFMKPSEIAQEEQAFAPRISERESPSQWRPGGTSLDRAPYEVRSGAVFYSRNFDPKQAGSPTETPWKPNVYGGQGIRPRR